MISRGWPTWLATASRVLSPWPVMQSTAESPAGIFPEAINFFATPVIRDPKKVTEESDAVFYFPGCGSERLFGQVGLATQAMLYEVGAITVLPPGYLCCGYPQTSAGA